MTIRRLFTALVVAVLSTLALTLSSAWAQPSGPGGIYAINATYQNAISSQILDNPNVYGVVLSYNWNQLETADGSYDFSLVDDQIGEAAASGKKVSLIVTAGVETPSWVYAEGAQFLNFVWDLKWGPALCSIQTIPTPWDPVFLAKWSAFVETFGARYDSNPNVASVKLTGLNSKTGEAFLPDSVNEKIGSGKSACKGYNDPADWQAAGYTPAKVLNAWGQIITEFQKSFPSKPLESMMVPGGFPAIDNNNHLIPKQTLDAAMTSELISSGIANLGNQFVLQNDGLTASWIWKVETAYASQIETGYQTATAVGSGMQAAVNLVQKAHGLYVELYAADLVKQKLATTLDGTAAAPTAIASSKTAPKQGRTGGSV